MTDTTLQDAGIAGITAVPLSDALGVEIRGVDLADFTDDQADRIRDLWHENLVILFRDQSLSEAEQVAFGRRFGRGSLSVGHIRSLEGENEGVAYVTNVQDKDTPVGILPDGEMQFHSDQCYREMPSMGTMLYAMEVPSRGGNTRFANTYAAYETLSDDVKRRLEGLRALNVYDYGLNPTQRGAVNPDAPSWVHPVVRTHPATGRKALFVNRLMTARIEGLPHEESEALLGMLFDHQEQPQFVYEHVWRVGDLMIWDNRCTLHARTDFDPKERRLLRRVVVAGDKPF